MYTLRFDRKIEDMNLVSLEFCIFSILEEGYTSPNFLIFFRQIISVLGCFSVWNSEPSMDSSFELESKEWMLKRCFHLEKKELVYNYIFWKYQTAISTQLGWKKLSTVCFLHHSFPSECNEVGFWNIKYTNSLSQNYAIVFCPIFH